MSDTELLLKSEPVRRLEVFTGAGRRRRWSAEDKARIVTESYGEESVCSVARRHGLTPQQLFAWRRHARRQATEDADETSLAFAPVMIDDGRAARPATQRGSAAVAGQSAAIEIEIGGATVRVASGADVGTLLAVLCTVKAVS